MKCNPSEWGQHCKYQIKIPKMYLQIGDDLRIVHNDQLVYWNCQDMAGSQLSDGGGPRKY